MINTHLLVTALRAPDQPQAAFVAVDRYLQQHIGHKLLTYLLKDEEEVVRLYSNQPKAYPVGGRKPMGPTPWGEQLLQRGEIFLGRNREAMAWAFFDHEKLFDLGLGSVISVPVVYNGEALGAVSLCHQEHHYTEADFVHAWTAATFLIPAFLMARKPSN